MSKNYRKDLNTRRTYLQETGNILLADEFAKVVQNIRVKNDKLEVFEYGLAKAAFFSPENFKKVLETVMPLFCGHEQHDAQEFLLSFLDNLSEDLNRNASRRDQPVTSIVTDLFSGKIVNRLICQQCSKESFKFEDFSMLSLALPLNDHVHCITFTM
jgi:ubiquitin C-terminal hydrolase